MLELLPKIQKKRAKKEYFLRLSAVSLVLLLIAGILSLVSLSPSYFISAEKEKIVKKEFEKVEKSSKKISDDKEFQSDIKKTKEMISALKPSEKYISVANIVSMITEKRSLGIKINGISVNSQKGDQYQISLLGNAENRESLKSFVENLKNDSLFENADLPISNFTKISDIDFNITVKTSF